MADEELQDEAVELLSALIRENTVNPPGAERPAQELLAGPLREAGFEVDLLEAEPGRTNLVARLRGRSDGPVLGLLSHVDTVLADPATWSQGDPWSGAVDDDGFLWGRGALDMKSQTAAEVAAALSLARSGWRPEQGDLLVLSVADEEVGGWLGARWLCEHHPEKVRCDLLLNEGAGSIIPFEGGRLIGVCVGEKGVFRFRLHADGTAAHASMPRLGDNALLKLAPLLSRMAERQPGFDVTDGPAAFLASVGADDIEALRARDPILAAIVEPSLGVTLAPTRTHASDKINVIPAHATIDVDCRVPPGHGRETAERRIREILGEDGYRLEFTEQTVGNGSPVDSPLRDAIDRWVAREDPDTRTVPMILPGFTDSRTFRDAFGECVAYGFMPHRHMTLYETAPLIHSDDERIDVRDLGHAARCFRDLTLDLLG